MTIPEIQRRLEELAQEITALSAELKRRPTTHRAPASSTPMSPAVIANIRNYAARYPMMSQNHIATIFNVNPGRVSEALKGKRV